MNAQYSLTAGGSNVAIGYGAQYTPAGNGTNATTTGARQVSIGVETGQSVSTQLNDITTLGYRARAGADFGTAVGSGAHAAHLRSVALGSTTTTTADDQVMVGRATSRSATPPVASSSAHPTEPATGSP
jgi:hypothetical protein